MREEVVREPIGPIEIKRIVSRLHERLVEEFWRVWPKVSSCLSDAELVLWAGAGKELAAQTWQGREVAQEYFRVSPAVVHRLPSPVGPALNVWIGGCRFLVQRTPDLALEYLRASAAFLDEAEVSSLDRWAEEGEKLFHHLGRPVRSIAIYFSGSPRLLSLGGWELLERWLEVVRQLAKVDLQLAITFLAESPSLLARMAPSYRSEALSLAALLVPAAGKRPLSLNLLRDLPDHLDQVEEEDRPTLWEIGLQIARHGPEQTIPFWEMVPQCLHLLDAVEREALISFGQRLAQVSWEGAFELSQRLPSIRREFPQESLLAWMEEGLALARRNPSAGAAFFRLESRQSQEALPERSGLSLTEVSPILGPYAQALLGAWKEIREMEADEAIGRRGQRYPHADAEKIYLPHHLNRCSSREQNFRLFKAYTAHQIGLHHFGTHRFPVSVFLSLFPQPELPQEIFRLLEDARVDTQLRREYRGLAADLERVWRKGMRSEVVSLDPLEVALEGLARVLSSLFLGVEPSQPHGLPPAISRVLTTAGRLLPSLLQSGATAQHSAWIVLRLYPLLAALHSSGEDSGAIIPMDPLDELLLESLDFPTPPLCSSEEPEVDLQELLERLQLKVAKDLQPRGEGQPIPWELLKELIEAGIQIELKGIEQGELDSSSGLSSTDLGDLGIQIPPNFPVASADSRGDGSPDGQKVSSFSPEVRVAQERYFFYDEWDYLIRDYRPQWCRLREVIPATGSLETVEKALDEYASLIPLLRRRFQRLPPEGYQKLKRAPAGEDVELEAIIEAFVDHKAGQSPSEKVYIERKKKRREVSTLFLLDMSASTDEKLADGDKRIIDLEREAMLLMAEALEALKDEYAICGFSGYGRGNVEFFVIKDFEESYTSGVKARMDAIRPLRSTRMGPAIRHAIRKMAPRDAQLKTLILLSDGYPQDHDYGEDRTSREYGLHDTKVALLEARRRGIKAFCVTVDPAGKDYLQQMCGGRNYLVIRDVASLPRELPRIYQGLTV